MATFALVLFDDGIYYICKEVDVIERKYSTSIKYKDGKRYEGKIVARNASKKKLDVMKMKYEQRGTAMVQDSSDRGKSKNKSFTSHKTQIAEKKGSRRNKVPPDENKIDIAKITPTMCQSPNSPGDKNIITLSDVSKEPTEKQRNMNSRIPEVLTADIQLDPSAADIQDRFSNCSVVRDDLNQLSAPISYSNALASVVDIAKITPTMCQSPNSPGDKNIITLSDGTKEPTEKQRNMNSHIPEVLTGDIQLDPSAADIQDRFSNCSIVRDDLNQLSAPIFYSNASASVADNPSWAWDECNIEVYASQSDIEQNSDFNNVTKAVPTSSNSSDHDRNNNTMIPTSQSQNEVHSRAPLVYENHSLEDLSYVPQFSWTSIRDEEYDDDRAENGLCNDSGDSYIPGTDSSDSSAENESPSTSDVNKHRNISKSSANESFPLDISIPNCKPGHSAPDDEGMIVKSTKSGTKKDFCHYCKTEQAKLSRHLARKHADIEEVQSFLDIPKGHDARKKIISKIRKQGQFYFNTNMDANTGELKVIRRPNPEYKKNATDYATCKLCMGSYAKSTLRRHYRRCSNKDSSKCRTVLSGARQVEGRIHSIACKILRTRVFPSLKDDRVTRIIRYDELTIAFGNKLCNKYKDPRHYDMIRQKLRQLGRFLCEIKQHNENIHDLFSVFYPKNYDSCISTIQTLAGFNDSGTGFKVPSLATALGTLLKQVGRLCVSLYIKRQNREKQTFAEDFLKLLIEDYSSTVSRTAIESQFKKKRQSKVILPLKDDINKLQFHLRNKLESARNSLEQEFSYQNWLALAESCLTFIQLFNRRRAGEIERTLIEDFQNYEAVNEKTIGEAFKSFNDKDKIAALKYVRFTIRGKLGRTVAVLLHTEVLESLKLILKYRKSARVNPKNPYLFGTPGTVKGDYRYLRACDLMRKFAEECGAQNPQTLRGTILRKHIATMCMNLNLKDDEVSELANFMGHADKIHKDHYRQPILTREILNVSKLLEVVNDGNRGNETSDEDDDDFVQEESCEAAVSRSSLTSQPLENEDDSDCSCPSPSAGNNLKRKQKRSKSPIGKCSRQRWASAERSLVANAFSKHFVARTLPSLEEIQKLKDTNPGILNRNSATIKTWIHNQFKSANTKN